MSASGRIGFVLLMLSACSGGRQAEEKQWQAKKLYQIAQESARQGQIKEAEEMLRQVLNVDGRHTGALCKLSRVLLERAAREGKKELAKEAVTFARRAVELEKESTVAWSELGRALEAAGELEEAESAWRQVVQQDKSDIKSVLELARVQRLGGKADKALETLAAAVATNPASWALRFEYGCLLQGSGRAQEAEAQWRAIPENAAEAVPALERLASLAAEQGRFEQMRQDYEKLLALAPGNAWGWTLLGALDERQGRLDEAEAKFRRALELDPGEMRSWIGLARCLTGQGKKTEALAALRQADARLGLEPELALDLAEAIAMIGDRGWAGSVLRRGRILVETPALLASIDEALKKLEAESEEASLEHEDSSGRGGAAK